MHCLSRVTNFTSSKYQLSLLRVYIEHWLCLVNFWCLIANENKTIPNIASVQDNCNRFDSLAKWAKNENTWRTKCRGKQWVHVSKLQFEFRIEPISNLNASFVIVADLKRKSLHRGRRHQIHRTISLCRINYVQSSDRIHTAKCSRNCNSIHHRSNPTMLSRRWLAVCHRHRFRQHSFQHSCPNQMIDHRRNRTIPSRRQLCWAVHRNCTQIVPCPYNRVKCPSSIKHHRYCICYNCELERHAYNWVFVPQIDISSIQFDVTQKLKKLKAEKSGPNPIAEAAIQAAKASSALQNFQINEKRKKDKKVSWLPTP